MGEAVTLEARLCDAQSRMRNPARTAENPYFNSKYAPLDEVCKVVREACNAAGLFVTQGTVRNEDGTLDLVTRALCEEGAATLDVTPVQTNANLQKFGGSLTYLRRYALCQAFGLAGEPDDDGNAASKEEKGWPRSVSCRTCGKTYTFQGEDQYRSWAAQPSCCQSPNWPEP